MNLCSPCYSGDPTAVSGRAHSGRRWLWEGLSRPDHTQDGVCRIHGWRQRCMQCEFYSKCFQRLTGLTALYVWILSLHTCSHSGFFSGWLRQPSGVSWRGLRPGVMGSGMCRAQLPRGLCQSVRVPLLDWWRCDSLFLKTLHVFTFSSSLPLFPLYSVLHDHSFLSVTALTSAFLSFSGALSPLKFPPSHIQTQHTYTRA